MTRTPKSKRAPSLQWRRLDLHIHTPASSDYQEPSVTFLGILQQAEARGLDMLAFTDHNTVNGYRRLQEEIAGLELLERLKRLRPDEKTRLDEYRRLLGRILLLPGFEFTATFGFHILAIFPPQTTVREIEHILLSLNVPPDQLDLGSSTVGATADVLTAYRLIDEAGGLAIAAHANSANGVAMRGFGFGGQTKIAYTQDEHLHALEVTDLEQKGRRTAAGFFNGSKPEYPRRMHCIQGSDAHRLKRDPGREKNLGVGDRVTEALLPEVTFEALRELLQGNDFARTRPYRGGVAKQEVFDYIAQARAAGPNIVQSFHESATRRGGRMYTAIADVCAFANTNGGTVYVGLDENPKHAPVGVQSASALIRELQSEIQRKLTPTLEVTVDAQETQGKKIIRIIVPRGDDPPYAIEDNKIYLRNEDETSLAVRDEIVKLVLRGAGAGAAPLEAGEAPAVEAAPTAIPSPEAQAAEPGAALGPPRTGVEIVATEERDGTRYHSMRDLRNGNVVKNVTRTSARRLWHYAITEHESRRLEVNELEWEGDIALIKKYVRGGVTRYDLAQRTDGDVRIYYGVTEDGIHGAWKSVVGGEED